MIKFFRKIRQNLLSEGKTAKYLKYAVGEIILVVIGILIALQINNWNEQRKQNNLEQSTLIELKANLIADIKDFQVDINAYSSAANSCSIVIDFIDGKIPYNDSLNLHLGKIRIQGVFAPTKVAYDNLKLSGIKLISNDSLRNTISNLYEVQYKYVEGYLGAEYQLDHQILGEYYTKEMQEYSPYKYAKPVDYQSLIKNQSFRNLLMHRKMKIEDWVVNLYETNIRKAKEVIEMIDKELK
jgi:uncharacterized protein involved in outer membrane biogenesis